MSQGLCCAQAWALLEEEAGDLAQARALFEAGSRADPHHLHIWQARCSPSSVTADGCTAPVLTLTL